MVTMMMMMRMNLEANDEGKLPNEISIFCVCSL
jgi:hypothetical protein